MKSKIVLFLFTVFSFATAQALELNGNTLLTKGESRIKLNGNYLSGILSPPDSFTHIKNSNAASLYEETLLYSIGLGDFLFLQDGYAEIELKAFQSREETINKIVVHEDDNGFVPTFRIGGNFIHERKATAGIWLQSGIPAVIDTDKFVNPVLDYIGGGLNVVYAFYPTFGLSHSMYLGSGLFSPRKRNVHIQSATLVSLNFGQWIFSKDIIFGTGIVVESDITTRVDQAYQASALNDGNIKNLVFVTPYSISVPFARTWNIDAEYATKRAGNSVRGSRFVTVGLSKKF